MLVWVRKADALLRQCFIGAYLEAQSDLAFLSEVVCFRDGWQPSLLAFAAINAACRSALDVRVAHTEGYGKKQHSLPTRLSTKPTSIAATHQQVMEALIVQNPHLSRKKLLERARSVCSGVLKGQWALPKLCARCVMPRSQMWCRHRSHLHWVEMRRVSAAASVFSQLQIKQLSTRHGWKLSR